MPPPHLQERQQHRGFPLKSYNTYITYFYNKWVMLMLAGAILQIYSTHRISNELEKK